MEQTRILVGGGGPAGLIFAITTALRLLNLNKKPNITIFEGRWKSVGADVEWKGPEDGNVRRQQVVTLQDADVRKLPLPIQQALFGDGLYSVDRPWPTSRNIPIRVVEDRLLKLCQNDTFRGYLALVPQNVTSDYLNEHAQEYTIIVGADGGRSLIRQHFHFKTDTLGHDYAIGIAYELDKPPLPQVENVVLTMCQNRYLLNSSKSQRGFLNVRLTQSEFDRIIEGDDLEKLRLRDETWMLEVVHEGLRLFNIPPSAVSRINPIDIDMSYATEFYKLDPKSNTIVCLIGDSASRVNFWPGRQLEIANSARCVAIICLRDVFGSIYTSRGLNSAMKGADALSQIITLQLSHKVPRFRTQDFSKFGGFMCMLRHREQDGRSKYVHDIDVDAIVESVVKDISKADIIANRIKVADFDPQSKNYSFILAAEKLIKVLPSDLQSQIVSNAFKAMCDTSMTICARLIQRYDWSLRDEAASMKDWPERIDAAFRRILNPVTLLIMDRSEQWPTFQMAGSEVDCNAMSIREIAPTNDWLSLDGSKHTVTSQCGCDETNIATPAAEPVMAAPIIVEAAKPSVAETITLVTGTKEDKDDHATDIVNSDDDGEWYPTEQKYEINTSMSDTDSLEDEIVTPRILTNEQPLVSSPDRSYGITDYIGYRISASGIIPRRSPDADATSESAKKLHDSLSTTIRAEKALPINFVRQVLESNHGDGDDIEDVLARLNDRDNSTRVADISLDEFFILCSNGHPRSRSTISPIDFVSNDFVAEDFVEAIHVEDGEGIINVLGPYLVDLLRRRLPLTSIVEQLRILPQGDQSSAILKRLRKCTARDFLVALLEVAPDDFLSTLVSTVVSANVPVPILLADGHSEKGLQTITALQQVIPHSRYQLLVSIAGERTLGGHGPSFLKMMYKHHCRHSETTWSICHPSSIDVGFHEPPERGERKPLATMDIYDDGVEHQVFDAVVQELLTNAFLILLHLHDEDFADGHISHRLKLLMKEECGLLAVKVVFWTNPEKRDEKTARQFAEALRDLKKRHSSVQLCIMDLSRPEEIAESLRSLKNSVAICLGDSNQMAFEPTRMTRGLNQPITALDTHGFRDNLVETVKMLLDDVTKKDLFPISFECDKLELLRTSRKKYLDTSEIQDQEARLRDTAQQQPQHRSFEALGFFVNIILHGNVDDMRNFASAIASVTAQRRSQSLTLDSLEEMDISIHNFWRELIFLSRRYENNHLTPLEKWMRLTLAGLQRAFQKWILSGEPVQMVDGSSLQCLDTDFLSEVLGNITQPQPSRRLIVLTIIGVQSSGKSTLLNYLFGCTFAVGAGRCTKGLYLSYRRTKFRADSQDIPLDLLVIDSEGLLAVQQSEQREAVMDRTEFDRMITLLAITCSHLVVLNTNKDLNADLEDLLTICAANLDAVKDANTKTGVHFILRDNKDLARKNAQRDFEEIKSKIKKISDGKHDFTASLNMDFNCVHPIECAFNTEEDDVMQTRDSTISLPSPTFSKEVVALRHKLLLSALQFGDAGAQPADVSNAFKTMSGFLPQIRTVWNLIRHRASFLEFPNFKRIEEWKQMRSVVDQQREDVQAFGTKGLEIMINMISRQDERNSGSGDDQLDPYRLLDENFQREFNLLFDSMLDESRIQYRKAVKEIPRNLQEEGEAIIETMFRRRKQDLEYTWHTKLEDKQQSSFQAIFSKGIGNEIGLHIAKTDALQLGYAECRKIFNEKWNKIKAKSDDLTAKLSLSTNDCKKEVCDAFNDAKRQLFPAISHDLGRNDPEIQFNRDFRGKLEVLVSLKETSMDEYLETIDITLLRFRWTLSDEQRLAIVAEIKQIVQRLLTDEVNSIGMSLRRKGEKRIDVTQAVDYLKRLSQALYAAKTQIESKYGQDLEKFDYEEFLVFQNYLAWNCFTAIDTNNEEWRRKHAEMIEEKRMSYFDIFKEVVTNKTDESLSKRIVQQLLIAVDRHLKKVENKIEIDIHHYTIQWTESRSATHLMFEKSFAARDIENIKEYLDNSSQFMTKLVTNEYRTQYDAILHRRLSPVHGMIENTGTKLQELVRKWGALRQSSPQVPFSDLAQFLASNFEKNFVEDTKNIFGQCIITKPERFAEVISSAISDLFGKKLQDWKAQGESELKARMVAKLEGALTGVLKAARGCPFVCPLCGSKCELPADGHQRHHTSHHLLMAFNGCTRRETHPVLQVCTEPSTQSDLWNYRNEPDTEARTLDKFLGKYYPSWRPFPISVPGDEHVRLMRQVWMQLRTELCKKYHMKDNTPRAWETEYNDFWRKPIVSTRTSSSSDRVSRVFLRRQTPPQQKEHKEYKTIRGITSGVGAIASLTPSLASLLLDQQQQTQSFHLRHKH